MKKLLLSLMLLNSFAFAQPKSDNIIYIEDGDVGTGQYYEVLSCNTKKDTNKVVQFVGYSDLETGEYHDVERNMSNTIKWGALRKALGKDGEFNSELAYEYVKTCKPNHNPKGK